MGSTFTTYKGVKSDSSLFSNSKPIPIYLQFVPGIVIDVVTSSESKTFAANMRNINSILAIPHVGKKTLTRSGTVGEDNRYYPLFRGTSDVPTKGDPVLLCTIGNIQYYLGPLNTINNPNWNVDNLNVQEKSYKTGEKTGNIDKSSPNFGKTGHSRLHKKYNDVLDNPKGETEGRAIKEIHGDLTLEGRHGNSIRIGSRNINPNIVISNGRSISNTFESTKDGSLFAMFQIGSIREHFPYDAKIDGEEIVPDLFILPSDHPDLETKRPMTSLVSTVNGDGDAEKIIYGYGSYEFPGNQILQLSDRVTFGTKKDSIFLSSFKHIHLGAGQSLTISTNKETIIESSNIYLGKQSKEETEPLVLGNELKGVLDEIVGILEGLKMTGCIAGMSGPPDPGSISKIQSLKSKLSKPKFWSEYHFIEENGQKP
jgi:hypothetical protein